LSVQLSSPIPLSGLPEHLSYKTLPKRLSLRRVLPPQEQQNGKGATDEE